MSIKTSKIKQSVYSNEWSHPSGIVYHYYDIELVNGDKGSVGVKTKGSPKISVGAQISYTIESGKIKLETSTVDNAPSYQKGTTPAKTGTRSYNKTASHESFLGYVWGYAKDLIIAGKTAEDMEELKKVANIIYEELGRMLHADNNTNEPS